jgi:hypothetical protein
MTIQYDRIAHWPYALHYPSEAGLLLRRQVEGVGYPYPLSEVLMMTVLCTELEGYVKVKLSRYRHVGAKER